MSQSVVPRSGFRVLIIENHVLFAESLELALGVEGYDARRVRLDDVAGAPGQLSSTLARLRPRMVLIGLDPGPLGQAARVVRTIAATGTPVVVVTSSPDRATWGECVRLGARQVVSKTRPLNDLLAVVRRLHHGLPVLQVSEREELLRLWQEQRHDHEDLRRRLELLTTREQEVLQGLMRGSLVRDIARESVVSEATVRTQVKSILAKLGVSSQLSAVGIAHRVGWYSAVG
ncbi:LuxR family transcriptional regulator [Nocardioides sp. Leaf307]|nr:LuxR family transcriptional regulator [Nocardioides sp. Leaf285]KQQ43535.1 LuxR family transcriptional regulator [Nocardioides sp. Leaf307]